MAEFIKSPSYISLEKTPSHQIFTILPSHRLYTPFHEESQSFGDKLYDAVRNALILLVVVIVLTIVLIILYKKRCYKVMH